MKSVASELLGGIDFCTFSVRIRFNALCQAGDIVSTLYSSCAFTMVSYDSCIICKGGWLLGSKNEGELKEEKWVVQRRAPVMTSSQDSHIRRLLLFQTPGAACSKILTNKMSVWIHWRGLNSLGSVDFGKK